MFLDLWMIAILVAIFGICAWRSTKSGFRNGVLSILAMLEDERIIKIHNDGTITPYIAVVKKKIKKGKNEILRGSF